MPVTSQESAARRYRIEKYLTEGGMGAIYIGKKLGPGGFAKEVVLKQLLPEYTSRPEFRDLFFREAKISATLDHANIVHTFDLVESDQSLFIVMEYVRGADLRTIIRRARHRRRELSTAAAVHIALEILAGLAYAHARRDATGKSLDIIHRDVSPSNIICSAHGAAKLSDFGIARASTHSSVFYRVRGKVGYMSPEQARSQQIDHRCDLFSLSVCLYESLTGERLFVGDLNTPADEIYGVPILPVSHKRPGLPPALDDVLARALAPHVDNRYQSASELAEALRNVAHRNGLGFSAPELAAHLREILGDDPERWLRDEPGAALTEPLPLPAPAPLAPAAGASELVGTEAASIGIVNDIAEGEPGQSMLSPRAVSGSKDFDLDSMLNDEATRPGGEVRPVKGLPAEGAAADAGRAPSGAVSNTPPPVWTRDSGPFGLATPNPNATPAASTVRAPAPSSAAAPPGASEVPFDDRRTHPRTKEPARLPGVRPTSAVPAGRPLPRATIRSPAVPPPFQPSSRITAPIPPAVPFPSADARGSAGEIEDADPRLPAGGDRGGGSPRSFDIEDAVTPPPPVKPVVGPGMGLRGSPPAPYPMAPASGATPLPAYSPRSGPHHSGSQPLLLKQPQTMDFDGAVTALLPEQKGGPPFWLGSILILSSLVGGAVAAHRFTGARLAIATAAPVAAGPNKTPDKTPAHAKAAANEPGAAAAGSVPAAAPDPAAGGEAIKPVRPTPREADSDEILDVPPVAPAAAGTKTLAATRAKSPPAKKSAAPSHQRRVAKGGQGAAKRAAGKSAAKRAGARH
ncbi:MAG: protein kinase [Myxococcales bacterium]